MKQYSSTTTAAQVPTSTRKASTTKSPPRQHGRIALVQYGIDADGRHEIMSARTKRIIPAQDINITKLIDVSDFLGKPSTEHEAFFRAATELFKGYIGKASVSPDFLAELIAISRGVESFLLADAGRNKSKARLVSKEVLGDYLTFNAAVQDAWGKAAKRYVDKQSDRLSLPPATIPQMSMECDFRELAQKLEALAPSCPVGLQGDQWRKFAPQVYPKEHLDLTRSKLVDEYYKYQKETYVHHTRSGLSEPWYYIWRSLRSLSFCFDYKTVNKLFKGAQVEADFFRNGRVTNLMEFITRGCEPLYQQQIEELVGLYCLHVQRNDGMTYSRETPAPRFTAKDIDLLLEWISQKNFAKAVPYLHKMVQKLNQLTDGAAIVRRPNIEEDSAHWTVESFPKFNARVARDGIKGAKVEGFITAADTIENNIKFREPEGHSQKFSFDYVYYPFPETRAHENAASEQINREMSEPGIYSDGPREECVRNIPPRHAKHPRDVSCMPRWRPLGPVAIAYVIAAVCCRMFMGTKYERLARTRPGLTMRPDPRRSRPIRKKSVSEDESPEAVLHKTKAGVSKRPRTVKAPEMARDGNKGASAPGQDVLPHVPKLRGGGGMSSKFSSWRSMALVPYVAFPNGDRTVSGTPRSRNTSLTSSKTSSASSPRPPYSAQQFRQPTRRMSPKFDDNDASSDSEHGRLKGDSDDDSVGAVNQRFRQKVDDEMEEELVDDETEEQWEVEEDLEDSDIAQFDARTLKIFDPEFKDFIVLTKTSSSWYRPTAEWYTLRGNGERLEVLLDVDRVVTLRNANGQLYKIGYFGNKVVQLILPNRTLTGNSIDIALLQTEEEHKSDIIPIVPEAMRHSKRSLPDDDDEDDKAPVKASKGSNSSTRSPSKARKGSAVSSRKSSGSLKSSKPSPPTQRSATSPRTPPYQIVRSSPGSPLSASRPLQSEGNVPCFTGNPGAASPTPIRPPLSPTGRLLAAFQRSRRVLPPPTSSRPSVSPISPVTPSQAPSPSTRHRSSSQSRGSRKSTSTGSTSTGSTSTGPPFSSSPPRPRPGRDITPPSRNPQTIARRRRTLHSGAPSPKGIYVDSDAGNTPSASPGQGGRPPLVDVSDPGATNGPPESPAGDDPEWDCHPCPKYEGQYHHICNNTFYNPPLQCPGELIPSRPTRHLARKPPPAGNGGNGDGNSHHSSQPSDFDSNAENHNPNESDEGDESDESDQGDDPGFNATTQQAIRRRANRHLRRNLQQLLAIIIRARAQPDILDDQADAFQAGFANILTRIYPLLWDVGGPQRLNMHAMTIPNAEDYNPDLNLGLEAQIMNVLGPNRRRIRKGSGVAWGALRIIEDINANGNQSAVWEDIYQAQFDLAVMVSHIRNAFFAGNSRNDYHPEDREGYSDDEDEDDDDGEGGDDSDGGKERQPVTKVKKAETPDYEDEDDDEGDQEENQEESQDEGNKEDDDEDSDDADSYALSTDWRGATQQDYQRWMFGDEMRDELTFRGIAYRRGAPNAEMARLLAEADGNANYGRGHLRAYRSIAQDSDKKKRPTGYVYPGEGEDEDDDEE